MGRIVHHHPYLTPWNSRAWAEESLTENQLTPEAGLKRGQGAKWSFSRMGLKAADLKKGLHGGNVGMGWEAETERQRHRYTDREVVRPAQLGASGQWSGQRAARTTT